MTAFPKSIELVKQYVESKRIPSAALAIGVGDRLYVKQTFGVTSYTESATAVNSRTLYDVASLTKVMATTMLALKLIENNQIALNEKLPRMLNQTVPEDKRNITLFQLLTHTAGFKAVVELELYLRPGTDPTEFLLNLPLAYEPGTNMIYSDLGFILLGKILEKRTGRPLDVLAREMVFQPLHMTHTSYHRLDRPIDPRNTAYTERNHLTGEWLVGQVDDPNAYFLDGVSGNAGVFSNIDDMILYTSMLAGHGTSKGKLFLPRKLFDQAIQNDTPGARQNRGLGFELAGGPQSFSGMFFDPGAFGHTGFTGPHFLVSPRTGLYVVLLNNRVHPTRRNKSHLVLRRELDTLVSQEFCQMFPNACKEGDCW